MFSLCNYKTNAKIFALLLFYWQPLPNLLLERKDRLATRRDHSILRRWLKMDKREGTSLACCCAPVLNRRAARIRVSIGYLLVDIVYYYLHFVLPCICVFRHRS